MLFIVEAPQTLQIFLKHYREIFFKEQGFDSISRYITGLIVSPNKTLQGIFDLQVFDETTPS